MISDADRNDKGPQSPEGSFRLAIKGIAVQEETISHFDRVK